MAPKKKPNPYVKKVQTEDDSSAPAENESETVEEEQPQEGWDPDLAAAMKPGALAAANMELLRAALGWVIASKGEVANRVVACLILGFFAGVLIVNNAWMKWALAVVWILAVAGVAISNAPQKEPAPEDDQETGEEDRGTGEYDGEEDDDQDGEKEDEEEGDAAFKTRRAQFLKVIEEAMAVSLHNGTNEGRGIRITVLLAIFHKKQHLLDWDEKKLRAFLESIEIPVRDQIYFKVKGKKDNKPGVHLDDLTELLGHAPRLPAHLVPDLTPQHGHQQPPTAPSPPTLTVVPDEGEQGAA
ncbi:hypothetical protein [Streptomyces hydrogenans]|uniref:hypothetical protein n=1 Tax=Streptomyces hydrogenans TaxID=1873719 RepID=UPI0037F73E4D